MFIQRASVVAVGRTLQLVGVKPHGEGTVVFQCDHHVRAKAAAGNAVGTKVDSCAVREILVEPVRFIRRTRLRKRGAVALLAIRIQGELTHYECASACIKE